jgi:hypothetical protein
MAIRKNHEGSRARLNELSRVFAVKIVTSFLASFSLLALDARLAGAVNILHFEDLDVGTRAVPGALSLLHRRRPPRQGPRRLHLSVS